MIRWGLACLLALLPCACAVEDSDIAMEARTRLLGMADVDLQSCIGAPDQRSSFGAVEVLTYYATSTSNINWSVPVVGGLAVTNGGYCHVTFQLTSGRVTRIMYSGEKNATLAPDAFCAPILRTCMETLRQSDFAACHPNHPGRWWEKTCVPPASR